jgi:hypothetical protein
VATLQPVAGGQQHHHRRPMSGRLYSTEPVGWVVEDGTGRLWAVGGDGHRVVYRGDRAALHVLPEALVTQLLVPHVLEQLVNLTELARHAGVARDTVQKWRRRHADFPVPLIPRRRSWSPLWYWPEVAAWLREHDKTTAAAPDIRHNAS